MNRFSLNVSALTLMLLINGTYFGMEQLVLFKFEKLPQDQRLIVVCNMPFPDLCSFASTSQSSNQTVKALEAAQQILINEYKSNAPQGDRYKLAHKLIRETEQKYPYFPMCCDVAFSIYYPKQALSGEPTIAYGILDISSAAYRKDHDFVKKQLSCAVPFETIAHTNSYDLILTFANKKLNRNSQMQFYLDVLQLLVAKNETGCVTKALNAIPSTLLLEPIVRLGSQQMLQTFLDIMQQPGSRFTTYDQQLIRSRGGITYDEWNRSIPRLVRVPSQKENNHQDTVKPSHKKKLKDQNCTIS